MRDLLVHERQEPEGTSDPAVISDHHHRGSTAPGEAGRVMDLLRDMDLQADPLERCLLGKDPEMARIAVGQGEEMRT